MQRVYQASDILEANIVKGLLEHNDISAYVAGYYLQGGVGEIPPSGNTSVWVEDDCYDRAQSIIEKYENA